LIVASALPKYLEQLSLGSRGGIGIYNFLKFLRGVIMTQADQITEQSPQPAPRTPRTIWFSLTLGILSILLSLFFIFPILFLFWFFLPTILLATGALLFGVRSISRLPHNCSAASARFAYLGTLIGGCVLLGMMMFLLAAVNGAFRHSFAP
jgi:predicted membrane channel-forming protein YqfA (hemolysin III family)